jgi:hypothetical protein
VILNIPFVLPSSSVSCCCGECGCEFKSQTWDHQKALSFSEAMSLDTEAILSFTNPALKEKLALLRLKAVPELGEAFHRVGSAACRRTPARQEDGANSLKGRKLVRLYASRIIH